MRAAHPPRPQLTLTVGITGHRPPLLDENVIALARPLLGEVLNDLAGATAQLGITHPDLFDSAAPSLRFVSPLAEGADQLGADVALEQGYRLQAILPLPREDYRNDFDAVGAAGFDALLTRADGILELPPQKSGRQASYALAGRATVAHCDILLALWDGEPARGAGGTADIVALALRNGVPVVHLSIQPDDPGRLLWTGYGDFVDPVDMDNMPSRPIDKASLGALIVAILGPPRDAAALADLRKFLAERELLVRHRAEYPLLLAMLGIKRFRRSSLSSAAYEAATRAEWSAFHAACGVERHGISVPLGDIERSFAWADRLAQHFGQTYRSGQVLNFTFAAGAVLIALAGLLLAGFKSWLAIAELLVIALFVINTAVGSRRQWHRRWLEYRQLAERIRPMRSLKLLGAASPIVGDRNRAARGWIDWYARAQWRAAGSPAGRLTNPAALIQAILKEEIEPQIDYNRASGQQMHLLDHRLHTAGMMLFLGSILSCLWSVAANLVAPIYAKEHAYLFVAASAGLPALGGALFGIRMQGDFGNAAERSFGTAAELRRVADALARPNLGLGRQTDLAEIAAATMLADLAEWRRAYARRTLQLG